jgi:hypothetical protein
MRNVEASMTKTSGNGCGRSIFWVEQYSFAHYRGPSSSGFPGNVEVLADLWRIKRMSHSYRICKSKDTSLVISINVDYF